MAVDGSGRLQVVLDGWLWLVVDGFEWIHVVLGSCKWFAVLVAMLLLFIIFVKASNCCIKIKKIRQWSR